MKYDHETKASNLDIQILFSPSFFIIEPSHFIFSACSEPSIVTTKMNEENSAKNSIPLVVLSVLIRHDQQWRRRGIAYRAEAIRNDEVKNDFVVSIEDSSEFSVYDKVCANANGFLFFRFL